MSLAPKRYHRRGVGIHLFLFFSYPKPYPQAHRSENWAQSNVTLHKLCASKPFAYKLRVQNLYVMPPLLQNSRNSVTLILVLCRPILLANYDDSDKKNQYTYSKWARAPFFF